LQRATDPERFVTRDTRYDRRVARRSDSSSASELSEAGQAYLLALRSMTEQDEGPTTAGLARRIGVSTQAASEMVSRLQAEDLVRHGHGRGLALTERGRSVADAVFRRHALLEWLLIHVIGLGWAESDEEAARLQGSISPRVVDRIAGMLGDPRTCPHGNPIDAATARRRPRGIPLSEARAGTDVTIYRITEQAEEDVELLTFLEGAHLVPGTVARIVDVSAARDSITIDGPRGRDTIGLRPAALIRVLPGRADPALFHRVPGRLLGQSIPRSSSFAGAFLLSQEG
jgi:DtxR family Mn-dependent transcriptional regulator